MTSFVNDDRNTRGDAYAMEIESPIVSRDANNKRSAGRSHHCKGPTRGNQPRWLIELSPRRYITYVSSPSFSSINKLTNYQTRLASLTCHNITRSSIDLHSFRKIPYNTMLNFSAAILLYLAVGCKLFLPLRYVNLN